jgi:pyruvyl transferase EpsO
MRSTLPHNAEVELIASLGASIDKAITPVLPDLSSFALVDFPYHNNVGDSVIWLGEVAYLNRRRVKPSYVCTAEDYSAEELKRLVPSGPILIHGGGNFGDIWLKHQQFRETLMRQFPDRQIVQLPQSLHYGNPEAIHQTADIIAKHGKFSLYVRDRRSYEMAAKAFNCPVTLCPDMAIYLGPLHRSAQPQHDLFCLMRTDRERNEASVAAPGTFPPEAVIGDWVQQRRYEKKLDKALSVPLNPFLSSMDRKYNYLNAFANRQLRRGVQLLGSGRYVLTDRLHAHIISFLLQIPHIVLDNSYGKVSGFIEQWTHGSSNTHRAQNLAEALALYQELRRQDRAGGTSRAA